LQFLEVESWVKVVAVVVEDLVGFVGAMEMEYWIDAERFI